MYVARLSLTDFRNYGVVDITLPSGPVILVGRNGQGKTNLVEAIVYASTGSSHRVSTEHALVRAGADRAIIRAQVRHDDRAVNVDIEINSAGANRAHVNGTAIRIRDLPKSISSVIFAPEDLALVRADPAVRRTFLDTLLVQRHPRLSAVLADYERVVRQRNSLLKSARTVRGHDLTTLEVWDERLITIGSEVISARQHLVDSLQPNVHRAYRAIAGDDHVTELAISRSIGTSTATELTIESTREQFREQLRTRQRDERERGVTLVGPHRDDLILTLNGLAARSYASHGESWSYALALKLAAAELLREGAVAGDPVVILDDVFAELDEARRDRLADAVLGFEQIIVTAAVAADVPTRLRTHRIDVEAGSLSADSSWDPTEAARS